MKNRGFTLSEVLVILAVGTVIVATTMHLASKITKTKTKPQEIVHGQYACTIINGQQRWAYWPTRRNAPLPPLNSADWRLGDCQQNFRAAEMVPDNVGVLSVQLFGAGAAGKRADFKWGGEARMAQLVRDGDRYPVTVRGRYDIELYGQTGEETYFEEWIVDGHGCYAPPAPPGKSITLLGTTPVLNEGDNLELGVSFKFLQSPAHPSLTCNDGLTSSKFHPGRTGGITTLTRITPAGARTRLAAVNGSLRGQMSCRGSAALKCMNRFTPVYPESLMDNYFKGTIVTPHGPGFTETGTRPDAPVDGGVRIELNAASAERTFIPEGGCGGGAGSTNAILYPFQTRRVPVIELGAGGQSTNQNGGATRFGSVTAFGGTSEGNCHLDDSTNAVRRGGMQGLQLAELPLLKQIVDSGGQRGGLGGTGATIGSVNGAAGTGIGSGGGGGGVFYIAEPSFATGTGGVTFGQGGRGSNGAIIITW